MIFSIVILGILLIGGIVGFVLLLNSYSPILGDAGDVIGMVMFLLLSIGSVAGIIIISVGKATI